MFKYLLKQTRIHRGMAEAAPRFQGSLPTPDRPLVVVGDIHGNHAALDDLLGKIQQRHAEAQLIFVGDYIDRGLDSAGVLARVQGLSTGPKQAIALMGNHEEMLIAFLDEPELQGPRWLRHGGLQTLASFGISRVGMDHDPEGFRRMRDALRAQLSDGAEAWLRSLRRSYICGNVMITHAGADPSVPVGYQMPEHLTWGHASFGRRPRSDNYWVVHGHTVVDMPRETNGVISIDTGAYATGKLTAAYLDSGRIEFIQSDLSQ